MYEAAATQGDDDGSAGAAQGPVEAELARLVARAFDGAGLADRLASAPAFEPCDKAAVGDYKVEFELRGAASRADSAAFCTDAAGALASCAAIERAVPIPPRVYLRPETGWLQATVREAVSAQGRSYGDRPRRGEAPILLSFSSPNANKPLHIGHLRNNFLGMALAGVLETQGHQVVRAGVLSDWGVHICQAAIAHERWGQGATPESTEQRGDRFVGDHYVRFHTENATRSETQGDDDAAVTELEAAARDLLARADAGEWAAVNMQRRIAAWARHGLEQTCGRIGSRFDAMLRESDMLPSARRLLRSGLERGAFDRRGDGSIFLTLPPDAEGTREEVTFLRGDGSAVVYAQLLGVYVLRAEVFRPRRTFIVLGHEWELGLNVMLEALDRMSYAWSRAVEPIFYGMVTLTGGRMKSREGTVVEVDDLLDRVRERFLGDPELGAGLAEPERAAACDALAVGLLKYHLLRTKRAVDVPYDEARIWELTFPSFAQLLETIDVAGSEPHEAGGRDGKKAREALRKLLLRIDSFPRVLERSALARDPAFVLRFADDVCALAAQAGLMRATIGLVDPLRPALAVILRRCLAIVGIELPLGTGERGAALQPWLVAAQAARTNNR